MFAKDLLQGKRALITGGGTGLGKAMARRFLELGATVYICGRREEVLRGTCEELTSATGGEIHGIPCDVRDLAAVDTMITQIWNDGPLDILVNNAAGNFLAKTEELSPRAWEAVIGIVLNGTINLTMACGRRWLAEKKPANVLSIVATYASTGSGSGYVVPSAVAKAGVLALMRSLAVEWGPRGIRLNAIAPGPVPTEGAFSRLIPSDQLEEIAKQRVPMRRFGRPEEIADLAAFLVSDGAGYINGEVVTIDGGEWLQGAGEFNYVGQMMTDEMWAMFKPGKKRRE
ncbi:short-chain dehydrogenase/reductase SDR [Candidatus Koribacter versatilis Ellin345]|uniref:Short-chain dehydrogenase/reductase SDR n=1 Tax=Koribacter versatilis (strain Ellin345) TaxID=204669 RepID=Q1IUW1_KORVE|nr:SDR family oxidoreductase [Candidatus Koribacter versatilis]ABF39339.1 short-chain dehydrogenase/reductase SDR [Candidatus Koribacter versatilis Ellin345]